MYNIGRNARYVTFVETAKTSIESRTRLFGRESARVRAMF